MPYFGSRPYSRFWLINHSAIPIPTRRSNPNECFFARQKRRIDIFFFHSSLGLGVVLTIVIIANAILNVYQKIKSLKIIRSFAQILPKVTTVRRNDGREEQILTTHLVPGDIIRLEMGDKIPADCRILSCENLKVNNAELTGESKPIRCTTIATNENLLETTNMVFYSSLIVEGNGEALVVATGDQTVLGRVSKLTRSSSTDEITGLHREVNRFVLFVLCATVISIIVIWITWAVWLNPTYPGYISFNANVVNSIGMIVGFLPVGLPSAVTLVLVIVAKYMSSQQVLVKSLQTVETFNSVSMICTDKTGTLTQNKMTCTHLLWDINEEYQVPIVAPVAQDKKEWRSLFGTLVKRFSITSLSRPTTPMNSLTVGDTLNSKRLEIDQISSKGTPQRDLVLGACLCNNAEKRLQENEQQLQVSGDAADVALYNLCESKFNIDVEHIRHRYLRLHCLPFNSTNKFMIVANQMSSSKRHLSILSNQSNEILITMKGATDVVLTRDKCSTYKTNTGETKELTDDLRNQIIHRQEQMGSNGYRLIAMLQRTVERRLFDQMLADKRHDDPYNGLPLDGYTFIGLFCLLDPPRLEVPEAVLKARQAKIRIAMVTGDHPTTAISIAKQVHILSPEIIQQNGFDTFQLIGIDTPTGRPIVQLLRNGAFLETHVLGTINRLEESKNKTHQLQLVNDENKVPVSWTKSIWQYINFYFSDPKERTDRDKKQVILPYAIVIKGNDLTYSLYRQLAQLWWRRHCFLSSLSVDEYMWNWVLSHRELIFARTSPEQKLRIVMECQRRGEIVAVTGDGTNDAPALKRADLGVAMQSGSDVSKEAGDMVLMDNNFSSIIQAIETGRLLSDNLKKVAIYLLPGGKMIFHRRCSNEKIGSLLGSWSEIWPVFFNTWLGIPLALSAFQATIFCMLNGKQSAHSFSWSSRNSLRTSRCLHVARDGLGKGGKRYYASSSSHSKQIASIEFETIISRLHHHRKYRMFERIFLLLLVVLCQWHSLVDDTLQIQSFRKSILRG